MIKKKPFVLRVNPEILSILQKWADDEFRSVNGQIEMILDKALKDAGRKAVQKEQVSSENSKLLK